MKNILAKFDAFMSVHEKLHPVWNMVAIALVALLAIAVVVAVMLFLSAAPLVVLVLLFFIFMFFFGRSLKDSYYHWKND